MTHRRDFTVYIRSNLVAVLRFTLKWALEVAPLLKRRFVLSRKRRSRGSFRRDCQQEAGRRVKPTSMSPSRAEVVQDAVRKFLAGGSAFDIYYLASEGHNKVLLVQSSGVISKLVDLLVNNKSAGDGCHAFLALSRLVQCGQVAQDDIARAHNGAIFAWLAGPQDYGNPDEKSAFITNFTNNHPTNSSILRVALAGVASLAESIVSKLESGDKTSAAFTMKMLFDITRTKGETATFPDSSIATLVRIVEWDPSNADVLLSTIRAQAESVLAQLIRAEKARQDLPQISFGNVDHFKALASESSDARSKLLATIQLRQLANDDEYIALKIASSGGLSALVSAASSVDDGKILTKDLRVHAAKLLAVLAQDATVIREQKQRQGGMLELLQLCESQSQPHVTMALDVFRGILQNDSATEDIARLCGIRLVFEFLRFVQIYCSSQESVVVRVLVSTLLGADDSTNEINQRAFVRCDGAVRFLGDLLKSATANTRDELSEFMEKLGWVILELIPRLRNGQADEIDNTTTVLKTLEILSRVPANRRLFIQHEGVKLLVDRLHAISEPHVKLQAARILTNIACKDDEVSRLVVEQDAIKLLGDMLNSDDVKHQTAALMMLRNLASDDTNRVVIVSLGLFPRVIELASKGKLIKQRVTAAAVLGNLARMPANQKLILHHAGAGFGIFQYQYP